MTSALPPHPPPPRLQLKEKMGITDVRREAGRMSFGATAGSEYSGARGAPEAQGVCGSP